MVDFDRTIYRAIKEIKITREYIAQLRSQPLPVKYKGNDEPRIRRGKLELVSTS